ncbi:MAG: hypothetical protein SF182_03250 [Deltaproteobacteria bacterium]|nr:hypothetical protein [Deltaproteobacteria bacterium]
MTSIQQPSNPTQTAMLHTWEVHLAADLAAHDVEATTAAMTAEPSVLHMATMTDVCGGASTAANRPIDWTQRA